MYQILYNYGSEGYQLVEHEYTSVDEAVKDAIKTGQVFEIVKIIKWCAFGLKPDGELNSNLQVVTATDKSAEEKKAKTKTRK